MDTRTTIASSRSRQTTAGSREVSEHAMELHNHVNSSVMAKLGTGHYAKQMSVIGSHDEKDRSSQPSSISLGTAPIVSSIHSHASNAATGIISKFGSGVKQISHFTKNTLTEVAKVTEKIVDHNAEEIAAFSSLWEAPEPVELCRCCEKNFSSPFKHHCRSCAGVFCEDCCTIDIPDQFQKQYLIPPSLIPTDNSTGIRICLPCRRGECPSKIIKDKVKKILDKAVIDSGKKLASTRKVVDKLQSKMIAKVGEVTGLLDTVQCIIALKVSRGSYYGENDMPKKVLDAEPPRSGYFEIYNKSSEVFGIKILLPKDRERMIFELCRPSYIAVPPDRAVYSFFSDVDNLDIVILFGNNSPVPTDQALVFDTNIGLKPEKLSPSARIDMFRNIKVFTVNCTNKNVLLKYKGDGSLDIRSGTAISRVGVMGYLQGKKFKEGMLDYSTNIDSLEMKYILE